MFLQLPQTHALRSLTTDGRLLFLTRMARMFAYGFLAVVLALYLDRIGLSSSQIGVLLTFTLVGDTLVSLWIITAADRIGRRRMLTVGAVLMLLAGILFAMTNNYMLLVISATIGVISPSGYEVGPFLPIEQAALTQTVQREKRTQVFAWYNLAGSMTTALGAHFGGVLAQVLVRFGMKPVESYRVILLLYAITGLALCMLFMRMSAATEPHFTAKAPVVPSSIFSASIGLHHSLGIVLKLSALAAARIASRIGLINTMAFTQS